MIKGFISKPGHGKSLCLMVEAAAQENKKVAFISLEMDEKTIRKRLDAIRLKTKEFNIYTPGSFSNLENWLCKKVEKLSDEVDLICIDSVDISPKLNLEKLHKACFGNFMSQCDNLWVSRHALNSIPRTNEFTLVSVQNTQDEFFTVKQICRKIQHNLLPSFSLIEAVDLETNEIKTYNISNLLKTN